MMEIKAILLNNYGLEIEMQGPTGPTLNKKMQKAHFLRNK